MWGAAPRLGRLAAMLALAAAAVLACVRGAGVASAAGATNWAAQDSVDFDADHLTDLGGLYRGRSPSDGLWYAPGTSTGGGSFQIYFGATTDIPVPGDYNGDGKTDAAIFRPSTGLWYGPATGLPQIVIQQVVGQAGDVPAPGDYDGDGRTDPAIYRPSSGLFFAVLSGGGSLGKMLGQAGDVPVPRDYDGDGKTDPAVYRPSTGAWTAQLSAGGTYTATNGTAGDIPVPADYNGDGRADPVVFRNGTWTGPYNGATGSYQKTLGQAGDVPIPGYYDNNLLADRAIYRPGNGTWIATLSGGGTKRFDGLGTSSDVPVEKRPELAGAATTAPGNTALPAVSGITQVGQTLTATAGTWSGSTPMTYAYQWQRCDASGASCASIGGATSTTYGLVTADQGQTLRMRVTATNGAGSASASSNATATVQPASTGGGGPAPMPLISRGVPAFASSQLYGASAANDGDYSTEWRGSIPGWIAYDLSKVPASQRGRVLVGWYNDPDTSPYDHTYVSEVAYNNVRDYTVQVNAATGGTSAPASGWVTLATVTGNHYHSRTHVVDMAGYNWIRMNITAGDGSSGNTDAAFNFDVHDASQGAQDSWMFIGDSITMVGWFHDPVNNVGNFSQLIAAARPGTFPAYEDAGIGGLISADGAQNVAKWISTFPGRYVALSYGTNDANGCGDTTSFYNNYVTMVQAVLNAGKVPVVPTIPWARTSEIQSCGAGFVAKIQALYSAFPQVVRGPDLWTYFKNNPSLISGDNLHPSTAGYAAFRQQWANAMLANVYG